jgi:hypothetical protein
MDNRNTPNYSQYSDDELMQVYNQIVSEKNKIDWAYYYICMEIEERKKKIAETQKNGGIQIPTSGGFAGSSQFQKRVDEMILKELKNNK